MTNPERLLDLNPSERLALLTRLHSSTADAADDLRRVIVTVPRRVRRRRVATEQQPAVEVVA